MHTLCVARVRMVSVVHSVPCRIGVQVAVCFHGVGRPIFLCSDSSVMQRRFAPCAVRRTTAPCLACVFFWCDGRRHVYKGCVDKARWYKEELVGAMVCAQHGNRKVDVFLRPDGESTEGCVPALPCRALTCCALPACRAAGRAAVVWLDCA